MTALIWDLDGTLLDSYKIIVPSTLKTLREAGVEAEETETYRYLIANSVKTLLENTGRERGLDGDELWRRYQEISTARDGEVALMDGAAEALRELRALGVRNFVYTHKGPTGVSVLERLGIGAYFEYVLTAGAGLPRKPAPDGIEWIVRRFNLDKRRTFYIGDRRIDVECAENSGVRCILYLPESSVGAPTGREWRVVRDLRQIPDIIKSEQEKG